MRKMRAYLLASLALSIAPEAVTAQDYLRKACGAADSVVVGTVQSTRGSGNPAVLQLNIESVIKGDLSPLTTTAVRWPGSLMSIQLTADNYRGLWFLNRAPSGLWEVDPIGGLRAPLFASGLAVVPGDRSDRGTAAPATCYEAVWAELKDSVERVDESLPYFVVADTLGREGPGLFDAVPGAASALPAFAQSSSVNLRALALGIGIRRQDVQSLGQLASETTAIGKAQLTGGIWSGLRAWRNQDPAAVAALGKIVRTPGATTLISAAAEALMTIHTKDTVPHLASLLTSADPELQNMAIRGLSLFVNGAPVLTADGIRRMAYLTEDRSTGFKDEAVASYVAVGGPPADLRDAYVEAWQAWWTRMKGRIPAAEAR